MFWVRARNGVHINLHYFMLVSVDPAPNRSMSEDGDSDDLWDVNAYYDPTGDRESAFTLYQGPRKDCADFVNNLLATANAGRVQPVAR